MEAGVGNGVPGDLAPLHDFQGGLHGVEKRHSGGFPGLQRHRLGDVAEDHVRRHVGLHNFVAADGDGVQEDAAPAVRGGGGAVTAVDLPDSICHMGDGFPSGNVLFQNLQTGLLVVGEAGLHRSGSGQQSDVLMGVGFDVGFLHGLLRNAVHTGLEVMQGLFPIHGNGGGVAARQGFHQECRLDFFIGLGIRFGNFQAGQRSVGGRHHVLLVPVRHIHIDTVGRGVQGIALRGLHLHEGPEACGDVVDLDDAPAGGHIAADDLPIPIDVVNGTVQAPVCPGNDLLEGNVTIPGHGSGRIVPALGLIVRHHLAGAVIGEKALAASGAGDGEDGPLGGFILHDGCLLTLCGILLYLLLEAGVLVGLLPQEPVVITDVGIMGIGVGKAARVNVTGGIAACGFVALIVPDVGLQGHEQAAGDLAGVVRDIGHHPFHIFLGDGIHLAQPGFGDGLFP